MQLDWIMGFDPTIAVSNVWSLSLTLARVDAKMSDKRSDRPEWLPSRGPNFPSGNANLNLCEHPTAAWSCSTWRARYIRNIQTRIRFTV